MMGYISQVVNVVRKDLLAEFRTKEMITSMLIFAFIVITIFSFSFKQERTLVAAFFPGIIWVAFLFSGILGLNRSFQNEKSNDCILGLILCPADHSAIFAGKMIGNFIFMITMEAISLPIFFVLYDFRTTGSILYLILMVILGSFGFISLGTLLAALSVNTKNSEILLPVILFPLSVPIIIAAVQSTAAILAGAAFPEWAHWLKLIVAFDVIFAIIPFLLFEYVLEV